MSSLATSAAIATANSCQPDLKEACSLFLHALIYDDEEPLKRYIKSTDYPPLPKGKASKNQWWNNLVMKLLATLWEIKYYSPTVTSGLIQQDMVSRHLRLNRIYVEGSWNNSTEYFDQITWSKDFCYFRAPISEEYAFFMDIEGTANNPCEIAILYGNCDKIKYVLHHYVKYSGSNQQAAHCHGMHQNTGISLTESNRLMANFLDQHIEELTPIYSNGIDIVNFLPAKYEKNVKDINLYPWIKRAGQFYHVVARNYKFDSACLPGTNARCDIARYHSLFRENLVDLKVLQKPLSITQPLKRHFGAHCALYDAFEMYLKYIKQGLE